MSKCICVDYINVNPDPVANPDCPIHGSLHPRTHKSEVDKEIAPSIDLVMEMEELEAENARLRQIIESADRRITPLSGGDVGLNDTVIMIADHNTSTMRMRQRIKTLVDDNRIYETVLADIIDGLDSNYDDSGGLTMTEWTALIGNARRVLRGQAALEEGDPTDKPSHILNFEGEDYPLYPPEDSE